MKERSMSEDGYRFGFNGKENDRDFGNSQIIQDYGFRVYNPALGKFLSVDPLSPDFPFYTPYQFAGNKPIAHIDLDGLEELSTKEKNGEGVYHIGAIIIQNATEYQFQGDGVWVKVFSGETRDGVIYSTKNLWEDLPTSYGRKSGYTYTKNELEIRSILLRTNNPIARYIKNSELNGLAEPIDRLNFERKYGDKGAFMVWQMYFGMALDLDGPSGGVRRTSIGRIKGGKSSNGSVGGNKINTDVDCACFVSGTKVLIEEGTKEIQDIVEGDLVWAYDEVTGELALKEVTDTFIIEEEEGTYHLFIGNEEIIATGSHPFFIGEKWIEVKNLQVGDSVQLYSGEKKIIEQIEFKEGSVTVYNFTVKDYHNYYVSRESILVHNCGTAKQAVKELKNGSTRVSVKTKADAETVFREVFLGGKKGFRNSDGFNSTSAKDFFETAKGGTENYYHWDNKWVYNEKYGGYHLENHDPFTDPDAFIPHLQIHQRGSKVVKIFFQGEQPPQK